jgi:hypothetical protein
VTEDAVRGVLAGFTAQQVDWTITANEAVSAIAIGMTPGTRDTVTVTYVGNDCERTGTALFVPVLFDVDVGAHDVTATIDGGFEAFSAGAEDITIYDSTWGLNAGDATPSPGWLAASGDTGGGEDWTLGFGGTLDSLGLSVEVGGGGLWSGQIEWAR